MKAIAYLRVSTADQDLGLESQEERIRAYASLRGLQLVQIISDNGISGAKPLASRPGGSKLERALRSRKAEAVVILKLDRAFRSAVDCLQTVEKWDRRGIAMHIVDMGGSSIDSSSAAGRFMLTMLSGVAEMERRLIGERTKSALSVKRNRSERISGQAPYGFEFSPEGQVIENESEQLVIQRIKQLRSEGLSMRAVIDQLEAEGLSNRNAGRFGLSVVHSICRRAA